MNNKHSSTVEKPSLQANLCDLSCNSKPPTLAQWLRAEPFTLTMSSGFFGFFAHAGMLSALIKQGLYPSKVTGSSAGALIAGCWASGLAIDELQAALLKLDKSDFWDPFPGLGLLRGRLFRNQLSSMLGCVTFDECQIPLAVSVWQGFSRKVEIVNDGRLDRAIYASCAVPFLFQPLWSNFRPYWDGGIGDRPGLCGTLPSERVFYHHIASRSPWRSKHSPVLQLPQRTGLTSFAIEELPRSGPDKLERGAEILKRAEMTTHFALQQPLQSWGENRGYYQRMAALE